MSMKKFAPVISFAVLFTFFALIGCIFVFLPKEKLQKAVADTQAPIPTPTLAFSNSTAGWNVYTNKELGIKFSYPATWIVSEKESIQFLDKSMPLTPLLLIRKNFAFDLKNIPPCPKEFHDSDAFPCHPEGEIQSPGPSNTILSYPNQQKIVVEAPDSADNTTNDKKPARKIVSTFYIEQKAKGGEYRIAQIDAPKLEFTFFTNTSDMHGITNSIISSLRDY